MNIIKLDNISFGYAKQDFINNLSLEIPEKSIYGFIGPNGAGKTTIIKLILGLLKLKSGRIYIKGMELNSQKLANLPKTGSLINSPSLYTHLTAYENLKIYKLLYKLSDDDVLDALIKVGLSAEKNKLVKHFSMGMKQRLGIAIALLNKPELIILDEPFNSIDPIGRNILKELIKELQPKGVTFFISSHELAEIEKICSHLAIIDKGSILYNGSIESFLIHQPKKIRIICSNQLHLYNKLQSKGYLIEKDLVLIRNNDDFSRLLKYIASVDIDIYSIDTIIGGLELFFSNINNT